MKNNMRHAPAAVFLIVVVGGFSLRPAAAQALFGKDKELERVTARAGELESKAITLESRLKDVQQQYLQLSEEHKQLTVDRDNLLTQLKDHQSQTHDYDQVRSERDLLQQLLKKAAGEERTLRGQLSETEARLHDVQQALEQVAQERATLTTQLAEAKKRSKEAQLSHEASAQRQENAELNRVLNAAQRELAESQRRETSLQVRLKQVQERYTASVAENSTLRSQQRTIPKDVSRITREHERLIKENADMHYNLGVLFSKQRDYSRALVEFRKVVELRPDDADAYYNLGVIYAEHLPDREKALAHFRRYLTLNPGSKDSGWVKQYIASWRAWEAQDRLE